MPPCWECGAVGEIHNHHPVPQSRGGTKTIPLCPACHGKAHHRHDNMSMSRLSREALARKRARGERTGGVAPLGTRYAGEGRLVPHEREMLSMERARELRAEGMSLRAIARRLDVEGFEPRGRAWHANTVRRMTADTALETVVCVLARVVGAERLQRVVDGVPHPELKEEC